MRPQSVPLAILSGTALGLAVGCGCLMAGCTEKLETGYEPKKLEMNLAQKNALYAEPFTQQQQEAQQGDKDNAAARRPGQY